MHLVIALLILAACAVTDYFKRYFLSLPVVYHITMLLSIFTVNNSVWVMVNGTNIMWYVAVSHVTNILSLLVYIRGHILPINEHLDKYSAAPELYAAKRLIFTGILGVCLYTILSAGVYCYSLYYAARQRQYGYEHSEDYGALIIAAVFIFCLFMVALSGFLVTNGCIRYILNTDRTEKNRKWYILLTFIPIINVVYGFTCLNKISKKIKRLKIANK